ncbi:hypothetical protein H5T52_10450 [Candidatus Bipolaricaulota bacterium]|nr:hypothetical protein [Candidatus Bipolaricaulota bacterium]
MNIRSLESRLKKLEERATTGKPISPEVADAVKEIEADPEVREAWDRYGHLVSQVHERLENSDGIVEITSGEEEGLARCWDSLWNAAVRIAKRRGLPVQDVLRALSGG